MKAIVWEMNHTIILIVELADLITLNVAEFNMLFLTNRQKFDRIGSYSKWLNLHWKYTK